MLAFLKLVADFSRGSVRLGRLVSTSQDPPHPAIRGWLYVSASCPVVFAAANLYSLRQYLVLGNNLQDGEIGHPPLP